MEYAKLKIDRSHKKYRIIRCHNQRKTNTLKNLTKSNKKLETRFLFLTSRQIPLRREPKQNPYEREREQKRHKKQESKRTKPNVN